MLRVTNVGITAYITERGEVLDATQPYTEDTRVWSVAKSDGSQTFYVKYGDWFAWLCSAVRYLLLIFFEDEGGGVDVRDRGRQWLCKWGHHSEVKYGYTTSCI